MLDKPIPDIVDVEVRDARGLTPLLLAGLVGDHDSFMQLVKAGASPKVHTQRLIRTFTHTAFSHTTKVLKPHHKCAHPCTSTVRPLSVCANVCVRPWTMRA